MPVALKRQISFVGRMLGMAPHVLLSNSVSYYTDTPYPRECARALPWPRETYKLFMYQQIAVEWTNSQTHEAKPSVAFE